MRIAKSWSSMVRFRISWLSGPGATYVRSQIQEHVLADPQLSYYEPRIGVNRHSDGPWTIESLQFDCFHENGLRDELSDGLNLANELYTLIALMGLRPRLSINSLGENQVLGKFILGLHRNQQVSPPELS